MSFSDYQNSVKSSPKVQEMANFRDSRFQNFLPRGLALGSRAFGTWHGGPHTLWPRAPLGQSCATGSGVVVTVFMLDGDDCDAHA